MRHRPCGACRELVPAESGCAHWRPGLKKAAPRVRASTRGGGPSPTVAEFHRVMGVRRADS